MHHTVLESLLQSLLIVIILNSDCCATLGDVSLREHDEHYEQPPIIWFEPARKGQG